ncbi:CD209 antigen-like protein E [Scyliorhinus canicula]|uniref:CD209 antigen-like protein E n=1 Tax=Scyliorhinus canicula TaxID=7830 RepID=UPI0018F78F9C|nr:CD209 antigen-like protein E [Scyliorhinus canicula]
MDCDNDARNISNDRPTLSEAEPETTYAQISFNSQSTQHNQGPEVTLDKDKIRQETARGRCSVASTHLGQVTLIALISFLIIIIGLTVYVLQVQCDENHRKLCKVFQQYSESACPCGWQAHNKSCYRFLTDEKDWNTAKQECESLISHLIIINTPEEQNYTTESIKDKKDSYWIGITDRIVENEWKWVDGSPVKDLCGILMDIIVPVFSSSNYWRKNQPDNSNNEDCATIGEETRDGTFGWNDDNCKTPHPFICEKWALPQIDAADFEKFYS